MNRGVEQAVDIARVETVRHARQQREQPWRVFFELFLLGFVALVVVGDLPTLGFYPDPGAYHYGRVAVEDSPATLGAGRGFSGVLFVLVVLVTMLWTMKGQDWREQPDGLLTTVPLPALVAGDLLSKVVKVTRFLSLALVAGAIAFAAGSGAPLAGFGFVLGGVALVCAAVACGYTAGLGGLVLFQWSAFVREHRILVGSPLVLLYFGLFVGSRQASAILGGLPIGWYADVPVAAAGGAVTGPAAGVLLGTLAALAGLWRASVALAGSAWLADAAASNGTGSVRPSAAGTTDHGRQSTLERVSAGFDAALATACSRPTRAVIYTSWRRLLRVPQALLYVLLPFVLLLFVGYEFAAAVPSAIPVVVAVYAAGAVGAGATLNPLGNEGRMLPVTTIVPGGPRHVVRGYVLAAVLPGVIPVVGSTALAAGVTTSVRATLAVLVFSAVLTLAFAVISIGVGAQLPEFDGIRPSGSTGLTTPHVYAVLAYSIVCGAVTAPVFLALLLEEIGYGGVTLVSAAVTGGGATLLCSALGAILAYRSAVSAFASYQPGE